MQQHFYDKHIFNYFYGFGVYTDSHFGEYGEQESEHGQIDTDPPPTKSPPQKLRHCEHLVATGRNSSLIC